MRAQNTKRQEQAQRQEVQYLQWREGLFSDSRLAPQRLLINDLETFGGIRPETWQRVRNEKYSRAAERLTGTHHIRRDYYPIDPVTGQIIITESDGLRPRYTLGDVYSNGYETSLAAYNQDARFGFQLRRDELFFEAYKQVASMIVGETGHDTIEMFSTFPVEYISSDPQALREKFYDLNHGKQFKYTWRLASDEDGQLLTDAFGRRILEISAVTLYSPHSDLQAGGTSHGKAAIAAVLAAKGFDPVPFAMLSSDEYGRFLATSTTAGVSSDTLDLQDVARYDTYLTQATGRETRYGRQDESIEAYELFDKCPGDWAAYFAFHELLARHFTGEPLHPRLQEYLIQLIQGYEVAGKYNDAVSLEDFQRLAVQVHYGRIDISMALACNEIFDYAHSARMKQHLDAYQADGTLPEPEASDVLAAYGDGASGASAAAASRGDRFDGCEEGSAAVSMADVMALAAQLGVTPEEALRRLEQEKDKKQKVPDDAPLEVKYGYQKIRQGVCLACDSRTKIGPCNYCNDCDTRNRRDDTYIQSLLDKKAAKKSEAPDFDTAAKEPPKTAQSPDTLLPGQWYTTAHGTYHYLAVPTVGGVAELFVHAITGQRASAHQAAAIKQDINRLNSSHTTRD